MKEEKTLIHLSNCGEMPKNLVSSLQISQKGGKFMLGGY